MVSFKQASQRLNFLDSGSGCNIVLKYYLVLNLLILISRPQDLMPILGKMKLIFILSVISIIISLPRILQIFSSKILVGMLFFIIQGGILVPLAFNNFHAYNAWRDVGMQAFGYYFPLFLFFKTAKDLDLLLSVPIIAGTYFALWGITHGGKGPGGFLGDENDLALAIVVCLGFTIAMIEGSKGASRMRYIALTALMFAGVVVTLSRGGFVGLASLMLFAFLRTNRKGILIGSVFVIMIVGLPFVPSTYWKDVSTIGDTKESTADQRIKMWKVATSAWLDPKNFFVGAGWANMPMLMAQYEPRKNRSNFGKSLGGRAVHSSLFQLLPECGTLGALLFFVTAWYCFYGNLSRIKQIKVRREEVEEKSKQITQYSRKVFDKFEKLNNEEEVLVPLLDLDYEINVSSVRTIFGKLSNSLNQLTSYLFGIAASLIGAAGAGMFLSALYYPFFWMLFGVSAIAQKYADDLLSTSENLINSLDSKKILVIED